VAGRTEWKNHEAHASRGTRSTTSSRDVQREIGYISQATPMLITTNSMNDHSVYLIQLAAARCVRQASAIETNKANKSMMPK
jgi:hypothetical protein